MTQETALKIMQSGKNVFLTGQAGTGKSYLLNKFIDITEKQGRKRISICASTGIAATHINGTTIHSWAAVGTKQFLVTDDLFAIKNNPFSRGRILNTDILIIDEVSMLSSTLLDMVEEVCRFVKSNQKPFGGIQIILCGDFFQLPPVIKGNKAESDKKFAFTALSWDGADFKVCYLSKNYRQDGDEAFTGILNRLRGQNLSQSDITTLLSQNNNIEAQNLGINLFPHKINVEIINNQYFDAIKDKEIFRYYASGTGQDWILEKMKKDCLAPPVLHLKIGCKVMFVANNFQNGFANGTMGVVIRFDYDEEEEKHFPIVKVFKTNKEIEVREHIWERKELDNNGKTKVTSKLKQIPLRLAYAITIHKSQGCTFDYANMDLSNVFERNQGYVAISRLKTLNGLNLIGACNLAFEINEEILVHDDIFQCKSKENEMLIGE